MNARLTIELDAFARNIQAVRQRVAPAELMFVVKDDAYGHGAVPLVRRATTEGVRWFGAFDLETALRIRPVAAADARIFLWMLFGPASAATAVDAGFDIGVGEHALLEEVAAAAAGLGRTATVHLKIDTGLHRNGIRPEDWPAFVARAAELEAQGLLDVAGVWSHISEASDADDDDAREVFDIAVRQARAAGLRPEMRHLAASAASFARPEFRYDLVRVGAFCCGIRSAGGPPADDLGLRPIARLQAEVIASVADGVRIGIGALDGLPSSLAGRADVGTPAGPRRLIAVGDTESVVTAWPGASPGDIVTVYGAGASGESSATDLAELIDTIGEEIAVRVSPLILRAYTQG